MVYLTRMNLEALRLYQQEFEQGNGLGHSGKLLRKCLALVQAGLTDAPMGKADEDLFCPLCVSGVSLQDEEHTCSSGGSNRLDGSVGFILYKVYFVTNVDAELVDLESLYMFCAIVTYNMALLWHLQGTSSTTKKALQLYQMAHKFVAHSSSHPSQAWLSAAIYNNAGHAAAMRGHVTAVVSAQASLQALLSSGTWVTAAAAAFFRQSLVLAKVMYPANGSVAAASGRTASCTF